MPVAHGAPKPCQVSPAGSVGAICMPPACRTLLKKVDENFYMHLTFGKLHRDWESGTIIPVDLDVIICEITAVCRGLGFAVLQVHKNGDLVGE